MEKITRYNTPNSSSLEYILINKECKFYGFYHMKLKFKKFDTLYDYDIKTELWENNLKKLIQENQGLNIGKTIWCYIILGDIIEYKTFKEIHNENNI